MEPTSQFELARIVRAATGSLENGPLTRRRRSAGRRELTVPQLAQLVGYLLGVENDFLSYISRGWKMKRRLVIEHWCDALLRADGHGPRGSETGTASPFPAWRVVNPPLPAELVCLAASAGRKRSA